jgi:tetratricopeptide (TPR) repeat protein
MQTSVFLLPFFPVLYHKSIPISTTTQNLVSSWQDRHAEQETIIEQLRQFFLQQEQKQTTYNNYNEPIASLVGKIELIVQDIQKHQAAIQNAEQYATASATYIQLQADAQNCERRLSHFSLLESRYHTFISARTQLSEIDEKLEVLSTIDRELCVAQTQRNQAKDQRDTIYSNDPTLLDYEEWQRQTYRLDFEENQYREALELLTKNAEEACCPTCNQHFTEHTSESRIQHLNAWIYEELPTLRQQAKQKEQSIHAKKLQWKEKKK